MLSRSSGLMNIIGKRDEPRGRRWEGSSLKHEARNQEQTLHQPHQQSRQNAIMTRFLPWSSTSLLPTTIFKTFSPLCGLGEYVWCHQSVESSVASSRLLVNWKAMYICRLCTYPEKNQNTLTSHLCLTVGSCAIRK